MPLGRRVCSNNNNNCTEELRLHETGSKSIRVETVIDIHSAQDISDAEAGMGTRSEGSDDAATLPTGHDNHKEFQA
jgi:hypothetical protein